MKKFFSILLILFASLSFAKTKTQKKNNIVGFDVGIVTGLPVYTSGEVSHANDHVNDGKTSRVVIGGLFDVSFKVMSPLKIMLGFDLLSDFNWGGGEHANYLDYAFWAGLKIYPGIAGFNFFVDYALGQRADFIDNDEIDETNTAAWGNGFRVGIEYDFLHNSEHRFMPSVGFYYRLMPRGDDQYDNIFAIYVTLTH